MADLGILAVHNHLEYAEKWDSYGYAPTVGGSFAGIWQQTGVHTEITTAAALYVSSSSGSDSFDVEITGLDANWNPQTVTQTLAGQTKTEVGTSKTWIRVFKMRNCSGTAAAGDVYCYLDDTVGGGVPANQNKRQMKMLIGYESTRNSRLSVPVGMTGYLMQWGAFITAAAAVQINLMYRPFEEVAEVRRSMSIYFTGAMIYYTKPLVFAPKSDVFLRAKGTTTVSGELGGYYHETPA